LRLFLDEDIEVKEDKESKEENKKEEIEKSKTEAIKEDASPSEKEVIEKWWSQRQFWGKDWCGRGGKRLGWR